MGIIETNEWLEKNFYHPEHICGLAYAPEEGSRFYRYLRQFGMYEPSRTTFALFHELKKQNAWEKIDEIYQKYHQKWKKHDVDIYIFPINPTRQFLQGLKGRSGAAFPKKLFLFLSPTEDRKNWESLFVHEYHHSTRMHHYKKVPEDYHLLDSLVFEGLAEHAVQKYCGKEYLSEWTGKYSPDMLRAYWERHYKPNLELKKHHPRHDQLLFGGRGVPVMMGYAIGADLVKGYKGRKPLTVQHSFQIPSEEILSNNPQYNR